MDIILIYQNIKPLHTYSNASKHLRLIFISLFHIQATFVIYMILILICWSYHDIVILSWYIKISSPSSDIQANIWDSITDIIMTLWYYPEISNYQTAFPTKFVLPSTLNLELLNNLNNKDNKIRQGTVFLVFTWKEEQQQQEILVLAKHYDVCKVLRNLIKILGTCQQELWESEEFLHCYSAFFNSESRSIWMVGGRNNRFNIAGKGGLPFSDYFTTAWGNAVAYSR